MAFKLKPGEPLAREIRSTARAQLRDALKAMDDQERPLAERVHEVRVAIKKTRALTRLVRRRAHRRTRVADRFLRRIASRLSGLRDADVLVKTFEGLVQPLHATRSSAMGRNRGLLLARLRKSAGPSEADSHRVFTHVKADLRRARRKLKRWIPPEGGWRVVGPGLVDGYRDARRAMVAAYVEPSSLAFHDWRKAVKGHRYQAHVLEGLWPAEIHARLDDLERLGDLLGEEHDLAVLRKRIRKERSWFADEQDYGELQTLVDKRRRELRAAARPLGERLFAERPRDFAARLRTDVRRLRHAPLESAAAPAASTPKAA